MSSSTGRVIRTPKRRAGPRAALICLALLVAGGVAIAVLAAQQAQPQEIGSLDKLSRQ